MRDDRRRRHAVVALEDRLDALGRQDLQRGSLGRTGQGVRVLAHEERAVDASVAAVIADRLGDRQDVRLGERVVARRAPVPAGAEGHALARVARVGAVLVVGLLQRRDVDQFARRSQLTCQRMDRHEVSPYACSVEIIGGPQCGHPSRSRSHIGSLSRKAERSWATPRAARYAMPISQARRRIPPGVPDHSLGVIESSWAERLNSWIMISCIASPTSSLLGEKHTTIKLPSMSSRQGSRTAPHESNPRDTAWPPRCRGHTPRSCGRWRTCRNEPH